MRSRFRLPLFLTVSVMIIMAGLFVFGRYWFPPTELLVRSTVPLTYRPMEDRTPTHTPVTVSLAAQTQKVLLERSNQPPQVSGTIRGGIVPHHDIATEHLRLFFQTLGTQDVKTLVLLVPDHKEASAGIITTGRVDWLVSGETVSSDDQAIDQLLASGVAADDASVIAREHAFPAVMPYIRQYMPHVRVVPVTFRVTECPALIQQAAASIHRWCGEGCVVVASVDCSHYLTRDKAYLNDAVTLGLLAKQDSTSIFPLNSDYIDSSAAVVMMLEAIEGESTSFRLLKHGISSDYPPFDEENTTSYITGIFVGSK